MNIPKILQPTDFSNRFMAERYPRHPGPYQLSVNWQTDISRMFEGIMDLTVAKRPGDAEYGEMNESETWLLEHIVKWLHPKTMVEIGTYRGRSSSIMARNSPEGQVYTVDISREQRENWIAPYGTDELFFDRDPNKVGYKFQGTPEEHRIHQLYYNCRSKHFKKALEQNLEGCEIDFVLVDPSHDYETTKSAVNAVRPLMSHGAIMMADDYGKIATHIGVTRFFAEIATCLNLYWFDPSHLDENNKLVPDMNKPGTPQSAIFFINLPEAYK